MVKKIILMTSVLLFMLCCCKQEKEITMKILKSTDKITTYQPEGTDTIITLSYDENNELMSLAIRDDKSDFYFGTNLLPQGDIQYSINRKLYGEKVNTNITNNMGYESSVEIKGKLVEHKKINFEE